MSGISSQAVPPELKALKTFILRGSEVEHSNQQFSDIIAFCCRTYAIKKAFAMPEVMQKPAVKNFLAALMDKLEADRGELDEKYTSDDGKLTKEKESNIVKSFALEVFKKADDEYRSGLADKDTAKAFYAAATYLEVAEADMSNEKEKEKLVTIRKAAKFKATEILNAIKAGKEPLPPNYNPDVSTSTEKPGTSAQNNSVSNKAASKASKKAEVQFDDLPEIINLPNPPRESFDAADDDQDFGHQDSITKLHDIPVNARISFKGREFFKHNAIEPESDSQNRTKTSHNSVAVSEFQEAEGYTRKAVDQLANDDFLSCIESISQALKILEKKAPNFPMDKKKVWMGLSEEVRQDVVEYLLFAARTLELAGSEGVVNSNEGRRRAANLISNALSTLLQ